MSCGTSREPWFGRASCPQCASRLPFWPHADLQPDIGVRCASCGATLSAEPKRLARYALVSFAAVIPGAYAAARLSEPAISAPCALLSVALWSIGRRLAMSLPLQVLFRDEQRRS